MTAKFSEIQSQYKLSVSESDDGMTTSSGDTNSGGDTNGSGDIRSSSDSGVSVESRRDICSNTVASVRSCQSVTNCESDVIKGHSGMAVCVFVCVSACMHARGVCGVCVHGLWSVCTCLCVVCVHVHADA